MMPEPPADAQPTPAASLASTSPAELVVVRASAVTKSYDSTSREVLALAGVDLAVRPGTFTAIMGASGSGKSTLLHIIGGLTPPSSGIVEIEGQDLAAMTDRERTIFRRRRLGVIFQEYNLLPTLTALENVALPDLLDGKSLGSSRGKATAMLESVHLSHRLDHRPDALSGGEQQRVAIARALLNDPALILADEPTGNLDSKQSVAIWELLRRLASEDGRTILMVTHEAHGAAYADEVVILKDGLVVGTFEPQGSADATLVARRYQELAG